MSLGTLAVAGALALDVLVGDPPARLHPVAWLGRAVGAADREWDRPRLAGACLAAGLPVLAAGVVAALVAAAGGVHALGAAAVAAVGLFVSTSLRRLLARGTEVVALSGTDPGAARDRLGALAGRDATALSPGQLRSAAVESLGENLADGLVAPLFGFGVITAAVSLAGGEPVPALAAGVGAAAWVKAVNTLDSMLGYRDRPVGWAPARLDDAVMWVPARATALLLAVVARSPGTLGPAAAWRPAVPSPNSGWPMGVLAAALGVRLEKPGVYVLNPGAALPDCHRSRTAVRQVAAAGLLVYALLGAGLGVVAWS
jgi:adenosylcobinamide-phosphate synthase